MDRCRKLLELKEHAAATVRSVDVAARTPPAPLPAALAPQGGGGDAAGPTAAPPGDPVMAAGLRGVLNPVPTLGFLHSLQRVLPTLDATFERHVGGELGLAEAPTADSPRERS